MRCGEQVRGGGACVLEAGHSGYHSAVDHGACDGCGRQMRSQPAAWGRDGEYEHGLAFCFLCIKEDERRPYYVEEGP